MLFFLQFFFFFFFKVTRHQRLCRANLVPIWDFLVEHVRGEKDVEVIRANLALHNLASSSSQVIEDKASLVKERDALLEQLAKEKELAALDEAELRNLGRELALASEAVRNERSKREEMVARSVLGSAFLQQLDAALEIYDEYERRLEQEVERLSGFVVEDEEEHDNDGDLDDAHVSRSKFLERAVLASVADEKRLHDEVLSLNLALDDDSAAGHENVAVANLLYDMQMQHLEDFVLTEHLLKEIAKSEVGPAASVEEEVVELKAALQVASRTADKLQRIKMDKTRFAQELREQYQHIKRVQVELKEKQAQVESLFSSSNAQRNALSNVVALEVRSVVEERLGAMEGMLEPLASDLQDSVVKEAQCFDGIPLHRLQPTTSMETRIRGNDVLWKAALCLGFHGGTLDGLLKHVVQLARDAQQQQDEATWKKYAADAKETYERLEKFHADYLESVENGVLPNFARAQEATRHAIQLAPAIEVAFQEWKTQPAQCCIPDTEQRERFMRRLNYLRALTHDYATKKKKAP